MSTSADKTPENKNQSVANERVPQLAAEESSLQLVDARPEAVAQRKWQALANNSPQVSQLKALQNIANNSPQTKQAAQLQAMGNDYAAQQSQPIQKKENKTGLPDDLKSGMENLSGMSLDHVKVHYNSPKPAAVQAHAYAQGSEIHVASGQEQHLPHELGHVVQQMQGRVQPTTTVGGMQVNDNAGLESEATAMGAGALQRQKTGNLQTASIAHNSSYVSTEVAQLEWSDVVKAESIAAVKYTFDTYKDTQTTAAAKTLELSRMDNYTKKQKELRLPHEEILKKANTSKGLAFAQMDAWHKVGTKPAKALPATDVETKPKGSWSVDGKPFKEIITGANQIEATEAQAAYDSVSEKGSIALGKEADTQEAARKDDTVAGLESKSWGWGVNLAFVEAAVDQGKDITLVTKIPVAAEAVLAPDNTQRFADYVTASHADEAPWRSLWQGLKNRPTWYTYELDYLKRRGFYLDAGKMVPADEVADHDAADEAPAIDHATPYTYKTAYKND